MFRSLVLVTLLLAAGSGDRDKILIAHRGASAYAPEHTLRAYQLAIEQGSDYVEADLQITRDGRLVCMHDRTLERTTNVEEVFPYRFRKVRSDGESAKHWYVVDFTLSELQRLDAGTWFGDGFRGLSVPTFSQVIGLVRGRAGLYPELKAAEFYRTRGFDMVKLFVDSLKGAGLWDADRSRDTPLIIQSFEPSTLRRLRADFACRLKTVLLINDRMKSEWTSDTGLERLARFADGIGPEKSIIWNDPNLVERAHRRGLTVTPYTFSSRAVPPPFDNVADEMHHYLWEFGVDALFTDNPDRFPRTK